MKTEKQEIPFPLPDNLTHKWQKILEFSCSYWLPFQPIIPTPQLVNKSNNLSGISRECYPIRWSNRSRIQPKTYRKRQHFIRRRNRALLHCPKRKKICEKPLRSHFSRICKCLKNRIHEPKIIFHREVLLFFQCKVTFLRCSFIFCIIVLYWHDVE